MGGEKLQHQFEIHQDQLDFLKKVADETGLEDENKAIRVLLDYAMQEGDQEVIFETVRCHHC